MAHTILAMSVPAKELVDNGESSANAEKDVMTDGLAGSAGMDHGGSSTNSERDVMTYGSAGSSGAGDPASVEKIVVKTSVCERTSSHGAVGGSSCNQWQYWST